MVTLPYIVLVEPCPHETSCRRKAYAAAVGVILSQQHSVHSWVLTHVNQIHIYSSYYYKLFIVMTGST